MPDVPAVRAPVSPTIGGLLLWPAAGLLLTLATLVLQFPNPAHMEIVSVLLEAPSLLFVPGSEGRALLLWPFLEFLYVCGIVLTLFATVLFFRRSRWTKGIMIVWLLVGIGITVGAFFESMPLLAVHHSYLIEGASTEVAEWAARFIAWPSWFLVPVLKVPALIHIESQSYMYAQLGTLSVWLLYFLISRRVATTFIR